MIPETFEGEMYAGPMRAVWMRCDRCGKRRIAGLFVEMHPSLEKIKKGHPWWRECLTCALETMTKRVEKWP